MGLKKGGKEKEKALEEFEKASGGRSSIPAGLWMLCALT
jgi:hypothetical protein